MHGTAPASHNSIFVYRSGLPLYTFCFQRLSKLAYDTHTPHTHKRNSSRARDVGSAHVQDAHTQMCVRRCSISSHTSLSVFSRNSNCRIDNTRPQKLTRVCSGFWPSVRSFALRIARPAPTAIRGFRARYCIRTQHQSHVRYRLK